VRTRGGPQPDAELRRVLFEQVANISLSIDDSAASDVVRKVGRGEVEFGIASGEIGISELHVQPLMDDPFRLICRRDEPIAKNRNVRWAQLAGRRLVMLNNTSGSRQVIEATLAGTGTQVEVFLELAHPSSVLGMVEAGVGIAIVPGARRPSPRRLHPCNLPPHKTRGEPNYLIVATSRSLALAGRLRSLGCAPTSLSECRANIFNQRYEHFKDVLNAGNTSTLWSFRLRSGPVWLDLRPRISDRQLPFLGGGLVCGALATVLADLLASDVAGRAGRGTCHS
jgi:hypothetical protein